jgi:signal transduction histidine kinase
VTPRTAATVLALALAGAGPARADLALIQERLAALRASPRRDLRDPENRKELAFFWRELARHDSQLPAAYQLIRPRLVLLGERERLGLLHRMPNDVIREFRGTMALVLQAALLAHQAILEEGRYRRPTPEEAGAVAKAALPLFDGPTTARNYAPRAVALAALTEISLPGDPGREAITDHRLIARQVKDTFGRGFRGIVAPFSPALGAAMDRDLAALHAALAPPPSPPPSAAGPATAPPAARVEPPPSPTPAPRRPGRRRPFRWLWLLLGMAGAGGAGYALARRRAPEGAPLAPEAAAPEPGPASVPADSADTDPPGRPSEPPETPPDIPDPLPLLQALEDLRGRVVHSLTGRFAIAKVLEDEPDRFAEAFLTDATLRESAELLEGLVQAMEELPAGPDDLTRQVTKLRGARDRYAKLAAFLHRAREEVAAGRRPRDMDEFQRRLARIAAHFKEVNGALRKGRAAYQVDLEALLEDRAAAFRGRLEIDVGGPGETDLLRPSATACRADLGLVLDTMLENAFQAKARTVAATFEDAGLDSVRLRLVDDGEGLGENDPDELMKSGISTKPLGTGTGLSQARRLAQAHGGTVSLEPDAGGGARVTLEIAVEPPSH